MATFLYEFMRQVDENWMEIDLLITEAESARASNLSLYNAICRSASILMVSHLEGFTKGLVKAVVRDLNENCDFGELPKPIQRTYCKKYLGNNIDSVGDKHEKKVVLLIDKFSEMKSKISHEPFHFPVNKNPNPNVINAIYTNFGIKNVFLHLHQSELDDVFSESHDYVIECIQREKDNVSIGVSQFPYTMTFSNMGLTKSVLDVKGGRTLWEEFIDQINMKRHSIAHGNDFVNSEDVVVLKESKARLVFLQLGLISIVGAYISENIVSK